MSVPESKQRVGLAWRRVHGFRGALGHHVAAYHLVPRLVIARRSGYAVAASRVNIPKAPVKDRDEPQRLHRRSARAASC
jgi:hypothetical protein